ncbi:MAG: hypothetical protein BJ554DRAFT_617 [Olpidium bornovanus]|uniref:Essential protein Yae1 N-terminal domain-containing protein n=1 Tax=Olpidium bornovanus TaxID=278681 RepID=A0A8H7ZSZ1_9FUNG|nr:MAG: hypothetical protein BJ554DRAFT_617 [Olpidium bornovanus]
MSAGGQSSAATAAACRKERCIPQAGEPLANVADVDLDDLLNLENIFQTLGRDDGRRDGVAAGELEGRTMGCENGFEIGREVGFYEGVARECLLLAEKYDGVASARVMKHFRLLRALIASFPKSNNLDAEIFALIDSIRAKYKAATAAFGAGNSLRYLPKDEDTVDRSY